MKIHRHGFKRLLNVDEALKIFLREVKPIDEYEYVDLRGVVGRVLYEDIYSPIDVPDFNRAAMDGYAVRSEDVISASEDSPIRLKIIGYSSTSKPFNGVLNSGEAVKIDTGAYLPEGADAVVMVEYTYEVGGYVDIFKPVSRYENVSLRGEDIRKGDKIASRGRLITSQDVMALGNIGIERFKVFRKAKIGIAAFGSELVDGPGGEGFKVREVNRLFMEKFLSEYPIEIRDYGIIPDEEDKIRDVIMDMVSENDIAVSFGGTSLGEDDLVTEIVDSLGEVYVHGVALQPSKPVLLAKIDGKPYIGLPGYPVAVAISSEVFIRPILERILGISSKRIENRIRGRLSRRIPSKIGLRHYVRVKVRILDGEYIVEPIYASGAGITSSLIYADGYLVIDENKEGFEEGEYVDVYLFRRYIEG